MDWTWYLFRFDGRINRAKLWLAMPVILGGLSVLGAAIVAIQSLFGGPTPFSLGTKDIFKLVDPDVYRTLKLADLPRLLVKLLGISLLLWTYFATSIKRLHDRDKRGWWMVPFFVIPGLYNQFADRLPDSYFMMLPALIVFVLSVWGFVEMYCLKGSRKTNRFGADPLTPPPPRDTRPRWDQQSEIEMVPRKASPPPVWRVKPGYE
ncbi:DUF805 domain-containing protein [Bradyrhizobium sp. AUGA SZCCT0283]|jgi:uncharacterized membrane protein YhaH (DUF805 family)|uniref:DUF805 domain-containing protein n=1 Tax=Bradyrhizobium sp. AUGA SZCCT0283 TaxID=2807671 RepID=UPI001BAB4817|nr:DUF805 domain-containing protein [Bradyrhizobium sp. AUGA SZCCT0283]MBR1277446.1 DUF805 domain-containing protein [Bradyrhizobium sp. AUGA SZCCT0283]